MWCRRGTFHGSCCAHRTIRYEQALLALRNFPIPPENASKIMRERCIASLVAGLRFSEDKVNEHDEVDLEAIREVGLPPMESLLRSPDERVQEQAVMALRSLSLNEANEVTLVSDGGVPSLMELLHQ